jgi:hypothetical protein
MLCFVAYLVLVALLRATAENRAVAPERTREDHTEPGAASADPRSGVTSLSRRGRGAPRRRQWIGSRQPRLAPGAFTARRGGRGKGGVHATRPAAVQPHREG